MKKFLLIIMCLLWASYGRADFAAWKQNTARIAKKNGVPDTLVQEFLQHAKLNKPAVKKQRSQAEFKKMLWDYLATSVSSLRIAQGQKKMTEYKSLLNKVTKKTGVPQHVIMAIWGLETNYGNYVGKTSVMSAFSTFAYRGYRKKFFEQQLMALLKLAQQGDIPSVHVKGSWAGGMGMTQFIPTTYDKYAIDFDGDGQKNLWQASDSLASAGHYLREKGWQRGYRWGREVRLPKKFDYLHANHSKKKKSLADWRKLGVRDAFGRLLPKEPIMARLFVPAGRNGPKFLLYKNFDVIKRYNYSDAYALAIGLLSDRILGRPALQQAWPKDAKKLTTADVKRIQTALRRHGFSSVVVDGMLGGGTRRALQRFQANRKLIADGFINNSLYNLVLHGQSVAKKSSNKSTKPRQPAKKTAQTNNNKANTATPTKRPTRPKQPIRPDASEIVIQVFEYPK